MQDFGHALRTTLTYAVAIPITAGAAIVLIATTMIRPTAPFLDRVARFWGRAWCRLAGVRLTVEGLEHVDTEQSYVVVSNHQSAFDIFVHFAAMPIPIRFLAKRELFKIPLFGMAMRRYGIVEVDRTAGRAAHQAINNAARRNMELGRSLMIYPEGTRSRDGVMLGFKNGAFSIARKLEAPVLPTAIVGSRMVWQPGTRMIRRGEITLRIMAPISTQGMKMYEVEGLRNEAFGRVSAALDAVAPVAVQGR